MASSRSIGILLTALSALLPVFSEAGEYFDLFIFAGNPYSDGVGDFGANRYFADILLRGGVVRPNAKIALILTPEDSQVFNTQMRLRNQPVDRNRPHADQYYDRARRFYGVSGEHGVLEIAGRKIPWMTHRYAKARNMRSDLGVALSIFPATDRSVTNLNAGFKNLIGELTDNLVGSEDYNIDPAFRSGFGDARDRVRNWNPTFDHSSASPREMSGIVYTTGFTARDGERPETGGLYLVPSEYLGDRSVVDGRPIGDRTRTPGKLVVLIHPNSVLPAKEAVKSVAQRLRQAVWEDTELTLRFTDPRYFPALKELIETDPAYRMKFKVTLVESPELYGWRDFEAFSAEVRKVDLVLSGGLITGMFSWSEGVPALFLARDSLGSAIWDFERVLTAKFGFAPFAGGAVFTLPRREIAAKLRADSGISVFAELLRLVNYGLNDPRRPKHLPLHIAYLSERFPAGGADEASRAKLESLMNLSAADIEAIGILRREFTSERFAAEIATGAATLKIDDPCAAAGLPVDEVRGRLQESLRASYRVIEGLLPSGMTPNSEKIWQPVQFVFFRKANQALAP